MKKQFLRFGLLVCTLSALTLTSCERDDEEENEEEVITTVQLSFVPVGGGTSQTFSFDDPDGPGGAAPTQQQIVLAPNRSYNVSVQFLDKTKNPVEDITSEVSAEAAAHRVYYTVANGSNITISNLNNDPNGVPLGVTSTWATGAAATGNVKVTLRHYAGNPPNKAANDDVNSSKSSTDVEVDFATRIQ